MRARGWLSWTVGLSCIAVAVTALVVERDGPHSIRATPQTSTDVIASTTTEATASTRTDPPTTELGVPLLTGHLD